MSKEFTPAEAMEFFQKMWNPLGLQFPGVGPQAGAPAAGGPSVPGMPSMPFPNSMNPFMTFDPEEVGRKINEFKTVETWLNMQVGMLQMTIKTLEMQKASLEALRTQAQNLNAAAGAKQGKEKK
jgi:hypothetical protein